jgi:hypothetical protein
MHLLESREYPVIDSETLAEFTGHERLFRTPDGAFLLHMSGSMLTAEQRIVWLNARDAISRLNETFDEFGSFWSLAKKVTE